MGRRRARDKGGKKYETQTSVKEHEWSQKRKEKKKVNNSSRHGRGKGRETSCLIVLLLLGLFPSRPGFVLRASLACFLLPRRTLPFLRIQAAVLLFLTRPLVFIHACIDLCARCNLTFRSASALGIAAAPPASRFIFRGARLSLALCAIRFVCSAPVISRLPACYPTLAGRGSQLDPFFYLFSFPREHP